MPLRHPDLIEDALVEIGLATVVTDTLGRVTRMNAVAEALTGWPQAEAEGRPLEGVFHTEHEATRLPATQAVAEVLVTGVALGLSDHTVLVARGGRERRIDHGAAPVRDGAGVVAGAVVVFCDVDARLRALRGVEEAGAFAQGIVQTVREPLMVLDAELRVRSANPSFYRTFGADPVETEGRSVFELGDRQWDIPALRVLLEEVLPSQRHFDDFEVDHDFKGLGRRWMVRTPAGCRRRGGGRS